MARESEKAETPDEGTVSVRVTRRTRRMGLVGAALAEESFQAWVEKVVVAAAEKAVERDAIRGKE